MLAMSFMETSQTEWAAQMMFARKKDASLRFKVTFLKLNIVTMQDYYPIPRPDECMVSIATATSFSTWDATIGYRKMKLANGDRYRIPLTSPISHLVSSKCNLGYRTPLGRFNAVWTSYCHPQSANSPSYFSKASSLSLGAPNKTFHMS